MLCGGAVADKLSGGGPTRRPWRQAGVLPERQACAAASRRRAPPPYSGGAGPPGRGRCPRGAAFKRAGSHYNEEEGVGMHVWLLTAAMRGVHFVSSM